MNYMAITVKDIREQEFIMKNGGYDVDQVDDFLDAVANQMEAVLRENAKLKEELNQANAAREALENAPVVVEENKLPAFNEPSYFKNLETTLRETLISAQRIADETIDDARKKARKLVAEAEEQVSAIEEQSAQKMTEAKADYEALKTSFEDYRKNFSDLIDAHAKLLKDSPLFD
ncbi:MAG: DivIVA domain-containing protein [Clostridiales bacterium]|nr:DivIVA domain-containing protein [Clostridiales bacterium]